MSKERESGIELCRIMAMFFVMIVHASFKSLGVPTIKDINSDFFSSFLRYYSESMSIICVNVFILISGWFSIKPKCEKLAGFFFQVCFWYVFMILSLCLFKIIPEKEVSSWIKDLYFYDDWFVICYIGLYIFAPVLNSFASLASKNELKSFLLAFFIFQTIFGFIFDSKWIALGYSPFSFMGLYLLARYLKRFPSNVTNMSKGKDLALYVFLTFAITAILMLSMKLDINVGVRPYAYTDPLVIIESVFFFLFFTKLHFRSKIVNWVGVSCFAAYLLHYNIYFRKIYFSTILSWYHEDNRLVFILHTFGFILSIFLLSIIIDKIRIACWDGIRRCIRLKIEN